MMIHHDPDEHETVIDRHVCPFHELNPGKSFAGCTCSMGVSSRPRPRDEVIRIKTERARKEEDAILAQAEIIKARRAAPSGSPQ